jgi:hypothetical protein
MVFMYDEERLPIAGWLLDIQLLLGYRWSRLSREVGVPSGGLRAGDRAPDAPCHDPETNSRVRLFDVFRGPHFTALGLGAGNAVEIATMSDRSRSSWGSRALIDDGGHARRAYGDNRLVLVRPDGYVGLVAPPGNVEAVSDYLRGLTSD